MFHSRDWSIRYRRSSTRYSPNEYFLLTDGGEPESYEEAIKDEHKREWNNVMKDEMESLHTNYTFEFVVKLPKEKIHWKISGFTELIMKNIPQNHVTKRDLLSQSEERYRIWWNFSSCCQDVLHTSRSGFGNKS